MILLLYYYVSFHDTRLLITLSSFHLCFRSSLDWLFFGVLVYIVRYIIDIALVILSTVLHIDPTYTHSHSYTRTYTHTYSELCFIT